MTIWQLVASIPDLIGVQGDPDTPIERLSSDSRLTDTLPGSLFFCIPGAHVDAHAYAPTAIKGGAVALVVERLLPELDVVQVQVREVRPAMAHIAAAFFGHPASSLKMLAITGTKGKTTSTYLVRSILDKAGVKCGLIGSIGNRLGNAALDSQLTTPDPIELHQTLRQMVNKGAKAVVMEASAHALDMHRLDGIVFEAVAYTNLSQDHLDYFGTMDAYFEAKRRLFTPQFARNCALNADEETTASLIKTLTLPYVTFGISAACDIYARDIEITENGVSFILRLQGGLESPIHLRLTGMFNVYNAMTAAALAMIVGASMQHIQKGLEAVKSVPGRAEVLETDTPYKVLLDYSHAPAALSNILKTVKSFTKGRVIALFGCGGDRDREKRPMMGEIGGKLADYCILTSDNARNEDPMVILAAIEKGLKPTGCPYEVIENRRDAIRHALSMAQAGDVVVLAGKGHETYQEVRGVKQSFDERVVVAEILREMMEA